VNVRVSKPRYIVLRYHCDAQQPPSSRRWKGIVIIPIGIADLYAILAIISVVGKVVERQKTCEGWSPGSLRGIMGEVGSGSSSASGATQAASS